jgi:hypothetical protein
VKDLHMRWRCTMMSMKRCSSGAASPVLLKTTICTRGGFYCSITNVERQNLTCRSLMGHNSRRNMKLKCIFTRIFDLM